MKGDRFSALMSILFASIAVLLFELSLLRSYAYISYYHFGFLMISVALLGFALSGLLIRRFYRILVKNYRLCLDLCTAALVVTVPLSLIASDSVRPDVLAFNVDPGVAAVFVLHIICILPPFIAGAVVIGLMLTVEKAPGMFYGFNLLGSGLGGAAVLLVLQYVSPEASPMAAIFPAAAAWLFQIMRPPVSPRRTLRTAGVVLAGFLLIFIRGTPAPDQYKAISAARMLRDQGEAEQIVTELLPGVRIDAFASDSFHGHLFAGLGAAGGPPPQVQLYYDGNAGGTVFLPEKKADLEFLASGPQCLAYRIAEPGSVLILGERGNAGLYTAAFKEAEEITFVSPTRTEMELMEKLSRPARISLPDHRRIIALPLPFLTGTGERFSMIHLAEAEGLPSTRTGMEMLAPVPLLTVDGLAAAVSRLEPDGVLSITRGIRLPPRDNVRIFATALEALDAQEKEGSNDPGACIAAARNHLAVTTLVFASEIDPALSERIAAACREIGLEIIYLPHYRPDPARKVLHGFPSPPGKEADWYRYAATGLADDRAALLREYPYDVRPRRIDSPYFHFFPEKKDAVGVPQTLQPVAPGWGAAYVGPEAAYRIVLLCLAVLALIGMPLILVPVLCMRAGVGKVPAAERAAPAAVPSAPPAERAAPAAVPSTPPAPMVLLYSLFIGLAFMCLEYTLLNRFSLVLGHPMLGASAVISAFLIAAGAGSMTLGSSSPSRSITASGITAAAVILLLEAGWGGIACCGALSSWVRITGWGGLASWSGFPGWTSFTDRAGIAVQLGQLQPAPRFLASLVICSIPAFFMGRMFPALIRHLRSVDPALIPYAWGVNGFASVLTGPLSMLLFLHFGYRAGALASAALYAAAVLLSRRSLKFESGGGPDNAEARYEKIE